MERRHARRQRGERLGAALANAEDGSGTVSNIHRAVAIEVVQVEEQLDPAEAVGDRVVELQDERGLGAVDAQTFDEVGLPQWAGRVERRRQDRLSEVEQVS